MQTGLNFDLSVENRKLVNKIVKRTAERSPGIDHLSLHMDLTVAHNHNGGINFQGLLDSKDPDFFHDVFGIRNHIDRETGELRHGFVPRYAERSDETA